MDLHIKLSNTSFLSGMEQSPNLTEALAVVSTHLSRGTVSAFDAILIDTAENRRYAMGKEKYDGYQRAFGFRIPILPSEARHLKGICASGTVLGNGKMHIPFFKLGLIIDG